jgi:hypothetical protein
MEGDEDMKIFTLEESAYQPGKYILLFHPTEFHSTYTEGSFAIMASRLLNLSYPDYCRLCRDEFGAEIVGKGQMYPIVYFKNTAKVQTLVELLNTRAKTVLHEREYCKQMEEITNVSKT